MKAFRWDTSHTYIGIAETVEEARTQVVAKIREYHRTTEGNKYSAEHEKEIEGEPDDIHELPCAFMIVDYS